MKKKVRAICRSDDFKAHKSFDNNFPAAQWFSIPKGENIRIIDGVIYFDNVPVKIQQIVTDKTTVIGFTSEISIVGLIPDADFEALKEQLSPKEIVKVKQMEMKF